jgi:thiol-disulfide isomerase/thioredoxin
MRNDLPKPEPGDAPEPESKRPTNSAAQPQTKPDRSWLIVALVFVGFWIVYLAFFAPGNRPPSLDGSRTNEPAEYGWTLEDLNGQPVRFTRFEGKAVFLNIWATWCRPCVGEMPSIAKLAANPRFKGKNIEFVCVSVDDSAETVRHYVAKDKKNWPMTVLHAQSLPRVFQTEGIPATFVISPDGRIVAAEVGASDWDRPEVVSFLEKTAGAAKQPSANRPG